MHFVSVFCLLCVSAFTPQSVSAAKSSESAATSSQAAYSETGAQGVSPPDDRLARALNLTTWNWETWSAKIQSIPSREFQSRIGLGNGYIGVSLSSLGPFYEEDDGSFPQNPHAQQGWPLMSPRRTFATIAGFYNSQPRTPRTNYEWMLQYGGESVISGIPHWTGLLFCVDETNCFDPLVPEDEISNFTDEMDYKKGIKTTSVTWTPKKAGGTSFDLKYTFLVHKSRINLGMTKLDITPSTKFRGHIYDILDGRSAERTVNSETNCDKKASTITASVSPQGLPNVTAHIVSTVTGVKSVSCDTTANRDRKKQISVTSHGTVDMKKGRTSTIVKYVGIASSDGYSKPLDTAKTASTSGKKAGWDKLVNEHTKEWEKLISPTKVPLYYNPKTKSKPQTEELQLLQVGSIVSTFYLAGSLGNADWSAGLNDNSGMVGGLTSDAYAGWIFWDADLFMAPGLLVSHPRQVQTIGEYRFKTLEQARANARSNTHLPLHPETDPLVYQQLSDESIIYPWISGRYGNCTAAGPCRDYQYHLNSAIALNLYQTYVVTGDDTWLKNRAWPVIKGIAHMFGEKVYFNQTMRGYGMLNMSDPDEYANFVDDGAYTLASISSVLNIATFLGDKLGVDVPSNWTKISENMALPYDSKAHITPEFNGMNGSVTIKQFDVPGTTYPLGYRLNAELERNNLRYYSAAQSPDGPAMTYSFLSVVSAAVSPATCESFSLALQSLIPYVRAPWFQFSEQQVDNAHINGGTHPAYPFLTGHGGFLHVAPMAWAGFRFHADTLILKPRLPPQVPYLRLPQFHWKGATFELVITQTEFTITRLKTNDEWVKDAQPKQTVPLTILQNACGDDFTSSIHPNETHALKVNGKLTLPVPGLCPTDIETTSAQRNILHCGNVQSPALTYPGRYPHGAVDGGTGTYWQPLAPGNEVYMDIHKSACAYQGLIDWGERPPREFNILARNASSSSDADSGWTQIYKRTSPVISEPYNASEANIVKLRPGNSTRIASLSLSSDPQSLTSDVATSGAMRVCADEWRLVMLGTQYYLPDPPPTFMDKLKGIVGMNPPKIDKRIGATVVKFELWDDEVSVDPKIKQDMEEDIAALGEEILGALQQILEDPTLEDSQEPDIVDDGVDAKEDDDTWPPKDDL